jgi:tRNA (guanine-N7-)-methyltransferase
MPRVKGPLLRPFEGADEWPILNRALFGLVDLGGHHQVPLAAAVPVDWAAVFGRSAPVTLEIGFNRGRFLRALARLQPERDHVGIEIRRRHAWRVAHEMAREQGPGNVRVVWGDAKLVAPAVAPPGGFADVYINFPDPWWKKKHTKRRLVDPDFAQSLTDLLAPGGAFWVKSDVLAIAEEISAAFTEEPRLEGPVPFGEADLPLSYREARCLYTGLPVHRFRFTRRAGPAPGAPAGGAG